MEKTTWLEEFKKKENPYNQFYKTNLSFINVILIHVNQQQEIVHLKTQKIYITKKQSPNINNDLIVNFFVNFDFGGFLM